MMLLRRFKVHFYLAKVAIRDTLLRSPRGIMEISRVRSTAKGIYLVSLDICGRTAWFVVFTRVARDVKSTRVKGPSTRVGDRPRLSHEAQSYAAAASVCLSRLLSSSFDSFGRFGRSDTGKAAMLFGSRASTYFAPCQLRRANTNDCISRISVADQMGNVTTVCWPLNPVRTPSTQLF